MLKSKTLIAIPVYNAQDYIVKTIDSCLNQTLEAEILVVDNCSTDNTQNIVREYEQKYSKVKLIVNDKNYGRVGNWNKCLDLFMASEYEYIKYVFTGDEILPLCIEEGEKAFSLDHQIGAVAFPYEFINLDGISSISRHIECLNKLFTAKEITYKNLAGGGLLGAIICNIYAKRAIEHIRFNETFISKVQFDIQVLENSKAYYLDKVLGKFNLSGHNTFSVFTTSLFVELEFVYLNSLEHKKISTTDKFSFEENKEIEQRIIQNAIGRLFKFASFKTLLIIGGGLLKKLFSARSLLKMILNEKTIKIVKERIYGK